MMSQSPAGPLQPLVRVCPERLLASQSAEHQPDHGQTDERNRSLQVLFVVANEASAAGEPRQRSLDDPSLGKDDKALGLIGPLDDLQAPGSGVADVRRRHRSLVAAIGKDDFDERKERARLLAQDAGESIPILSIRGVDGHIHQETEGIDGNVILDPLDLLRTIVADRVAQSPPFGAARTL